MEQDYSQLSSARTPAVICFLNTLLLDLSKKGWDV